MEDGIIPLSKVVQEESAESFGERPCDACIETILKRTIPDYVRRSSISTTESVASICANPFGVSVSSVGSIVFTVTRYFRETNIYFPLPAEETVSFTEVYGDARDTLLRYEAVRPPEERRQISVEIEFAIE